MATSQTEDEKKSALYIAYKPLRNHLRKLGIQESLLVVWHYFRFLRQGASEFPDMEVLGDFLEEKDPIQRRRMISEWELETLVREIFIQSWPWVSDQKSLRKGNYFVNAINKVKDFTGSISNLYISTENVLREMHRLIHHQSVWQSKRPSEQYLTRYYKIFSHPDLVPLLETHFGLKLQEIYLFVCALYGYYLNKIALDYPPHVEILHLTPRDFQKFIEKFSKPYDELRQEMLDSREIDERFFYAFNPLRRYPIVRMPYFGKDSLVCPDSTMLFWRLTDGIYYEIVSKSGFPAAFGESFQIYVGEVLSKSCKQYKVFPEQDYGSKHDRKASVDWIIDDGKNALFIECKTKRMRHDAKAELLSDEVLGEDLDKMADFIVQTYKSIADYRQNRYPQLPYNMRRSVYPIVLTLENWLIFGDPLMKDLDARVATKMTKAKLPLKWLNDMPYSVYPIETFENLIQIVEMHGIQKVVVERAKHAERRMWDSRSDLLDRFKDDIAKCAFLFEDDYKKILPPKYYDDEQEISAS